MTSASAYYKTPDVAGYADVPLAEKERLIGQVRADPRYHEYLRGCFECGICVAVCPSAKFFDFSPRRITQAAARQDTELCYQQLVEDIWECSQCFSCLRCPRGSNPGGIVTIMREVAVRNGLASARQAMTGYTRIIFKIMSTGTQIAPDMLQPDAFADWGPETADISASLDLYRRALPPETLHTTASSWQVADSTLIELYLIWFHSGALDLIEDVDPSLHSILKDLMEERLEDEGIEP